MMAFPIIELKGISKSYIMGEGSIPILRDLSLSISAGDFIAILGPSGSGKSTLLALLGLLDQPTDGEIFVKGQKTSDLSEEELASVRGREIGFVFQSFHLLPHYDALANVELPLFYAGVDDTVGRARALLEQVGLGDRLHHRPNQLSGGQQQRVAIARALANGPGLLLADEPTGNLDSKTGEEVLSIIKDLNRRGTTVILVTHDSRIASAARRVLTMGDGRILGDRAGA